jgi:glycosyltransferase involved in cell wall biosynthesis
MTLPTVAVIIPCYNGRSFVADAVRSVLDQADAGVDVVVVDDGSQDGSAEYLTETFGNAVRVIRQANAGAAAARNRGFAETRSDLVIWLDADDLLAPNTLTARRTRFAEDPTLEMLIGQSRIMNTATGEEQVEPRPPCESDYLFAGLLSRRNLPSQLSITYRRSGAERAGLYDTAQVIAEDFVFWVKAVSQLRWHFVEEVHGIVRMGGHPSLSSSKGKFYFYDQVGLALRRLRPYVALHARSELPWHRAYKLYCRDYALLCLKRGRRRGAAYWSVKALLQKPRRFDVELCKFLTESVLSTPIYDSLSRLVRRSRPVAG